MRIEKGILGSVVVHGSPKEWQKLSAGLEEIYSELKHDVLPAAEDPNSGGVIVNMNEAFAIMAIMEDEELTRSLMGLIFETSRREASTTRRQDERKAQNRDDHD